MSAPIIPRDEVAAQLDVPARLLLCYEARGLVRIAREGDVEGYGPAEIRRAWSIVTYQRDLGINLAGVEAILRLRDHMRVMHDQLNQLAAQLREVVDAEPGVDDENDA